MKCCIIPVISTLSFVSRSNLGKSTANYNLMSFTSSNENDDDIISCRPKCASVSCDSDFRVISNGYFRLVYSNVIFVV